MNILPHKSWHVRTKKNIERVRKDEAKAAEEEKEKERRILLAEQEARTELLRLKAKASGTSVKTTVVQGCDEDGHVNIFKGVDDKGDGKNKEHEKEAREEQEQWQKKIGLLTYLGQAETESTEKPWYLMSHEERMKLNGDKKSNDVKKLVQTSSDKLNDPLEDMKRYLDVMKRNKGDYSKSFDKSSKSQSKKKKKEKKVKKKKKKRRHSSSSSSSTEDEVERKPKTLEQLRAERLNREKAERERTKQFLLSKEKKSIDTPVVDERKRGYNSQFNPHLARNGVS